MTLYPSHALFETLASPVNLSAHFFAFAADLSGALPLHAYFTMIERATRQYKKPPFGLESTVIDGEQINVTEQISLEKPFGNLLHFARDTDRHDPKLLVVAPMSGHYATLLRGTVKALLPSHDVYITDWKNARDVRRQEGVFGFDEYVAYMRDFITHLGPNTHVLAVCQPTVPVLAAISLMAEDNDPNQPLTMTLMGGPIDPGANETDVTRFATKYPLDWFEHNVIETVPMGYAGYGRPVYPGFRQLSAFLAMNPGRHAKAHVEMFNQLCQGDGETAAKREKFYDEYLAVADLDAPFYLETIDKVFQRRLLANGLLDIGGRRVNPAAISQTALLTVEGEKDDISAPGQTYGAHRLCSGLPAQMKCHYLQPEVGHYGIFEGRKYRAEIAPRITGFIQKMAENKGVSYSPYQGSVNQPNIYENIDGGTHPALAY